MQDPQSRDLAVLRTSAETLTRQGDLLRQAGRAQEALFSYEQALALLPEFPEALKNRGSAWLQLGQPQQALASYQQAVAAQPDFVEALNNCGVASQALDQPEAALAYYQQALQLKSTVPATWTNCGVTLQDLGRPEEALQCYRQALSLQPDWASAHFGAGLCLLALGQLAEGAREYEWRWRTGAYAQWHRDFPQPLWLGQGNLAGKRILLHAEQGLGDTLQYCRYTTQLAALGAIVLLEVQAPLQTLLAQLPGVADVYARGATLPQFDFHCPLPSLPLALGTELDTIPAPIPYLRSDPVKAAHWAARLGNDGRRRIGLAWSGNPVHTDDRHRSIALEHFAAWFSPSLREQVQFVSVQTEVRDTDRAALNQFGMTDLADELVDFSDTAALLTCLERVITVDTAVAHLAGALGRPTTLLLPFRPDHRWLHARRDSPWYPTMELVRQPARGDWHTVLAQVEATLPTPPEQKQARQ
jgi:hypothetical protein